VSDPQRHPSGRGPVERPALPWHSRFDLVSVTSLVLLAALVGALVTIDGPRRDVDVLGNLVRFVGYFLPPDPSALVPALGGLVETVQIALIATAAAVAVSLPLGVAASRNLSPRPLVLATRLLLNVVRTIPSLLWALIGVVLVGTNPVAGVIGLAAYSVGYLAKFTSDALEAADVRVPRSLTRAGAPRVAAFRHGLWPQVRATAWSHALWMLEYNVRSASIVGYVGAGGIGTWLHTYQEFGQWERFATVLLVILVVVTVLDLLGEAVRARLGGRPRD
jgi:phosphonate transport system permease protein